MTYRGPSFHAAEGQSWKAPRVTESSTRSAPGVQIDRRAAANAGPFSPPVDRSGRRFVLLRLYPDRQIATDGFRPAASPP